MWAPRWCRGDGGLTSLEWLLIVAAVAAVAALGVVVVQRAVGDAAEATSAGGARATAAALAAAEVESDARSADGRTATWAHWQRHFTARCARVAILYRDTGILVDAAFAKPTGEHHSDPIDAPALAAATEDAPTPTAPQARCNTVADTEANILTARADAAGIAAVAATWQSGDTWAAWETRHRRQCNALLVTYEHLNIKVHAAFNGPPGQGSMPVTKTLLDDADDTGPTPTKPQIRCRIIG